MDLTVIKARLEAFGYATSEADTVVLQFCVDKVTNHIKNFCNIPAVPVELQEVAVDMICGEFLNGKYGAGQLDLDSLDLSSVGVNQITEGDTTVQFDSASSAVGKFNTLIGLLCGKESDLVCFRRLKW